MMTPIASTLESKRIDPSQSLKYIGSLVIESVQNTPL